jgi:anti-anti-sigma factor
MHVPEEAIALAVEAPAVGIVVVRVAGTLDRLTAPRLLRLLDNQLHHGAGRRAHLVVDLAEVRHFGSGGLEALRHARYAAEQTGVALHLTGLTARAGLLPGWATELIPEFDTFPVLEQALAALDGSENPAVL